MFGEISEAMFGGGFSQGSAPGGGQDGTKPLSACRTPKQRKPKETPLLRVLIGLAVTAVFGLIYYYFALPVFNFHSGTLYWFFFLLCLVFSICMILLRGFQAESGVKYIPYARKHLPVPFYLVCVMLVVVVIGAASSWVVFRSASYASLLTMTDGDFTADVAELSWDQIPMLDENSANNLADRKLGELSDLVSQFTVADSSAQINYQGAPVRVTYLNYGDLFKWWANRGEGIPAYMIVDMVTQAVTVVRLDEGMKYSPSEYFNRNLERHIRFCYPTKMIGDINFEIDEDGTPYWVASVVKKTIGLFGGTDIAGAVLVNAVTGEAAYYDVAEVPAWVDRVYSASLLMEQYDYFGKYRNGFWNSIFGQSGCTATTTGYNYIAKEDDVWLYTGITSISEDRGNIGFILVNQRTKQAHYYPCAGAEEYSAMASAEGAVQQFAYISTFPLLLNVSEQPTYFMALKDAAGLVKLYAMVNVQQYQIVATGSTVDDCQKNYHKMLMSGGLVDETPDGTLEPDAYQTVSGTIAEIRQANMNGDTCFYFRLLGDDAYYIVNARENPLSVILDTGDVVTIAYTPTDGELIAASSIVKK